MTTCDEDNHYHVSQRLGYRHCPDCGQQLLGLYPSDATACSPVGVEARVASDIAARQRLGLSKYGISVEANPLPLREWLEHAYQESLDLPIYLKRAIEEIDLANARGMARRALDSE